MNKFKELLQRFNRWLHRVRNWLYWRRNRKKMKRGFHFEVFKSEASKMGHSLAEIEATWKNHEGDIPDTSGFDSIDLGGMD